MVCKNHCFCHQQDAILSRASELLRLLDAVGEQVDIAEWGMMLAACVGAQLLLWNLSH